MLTKELKAYAEWLDEKNYRVRLSNKQDYYANLNFDEEDYHSSYWLNDYWKWVFKYKIDVSGIAFKPAMRVLDICCGRGNLGSFLEHTYESKVFYCDISLNQVTNAAEKRKLSGKPFNLACCADVLHLPFPAGSFDIVIGNSFLHHIADVPGTLAEIRRVQAPGGATLLLLEPGTTAPFLQSFPQSLLTPLRKLLGKRTGIQPGFTDLWLFRPDEMTQLFYEAGFSSVELWGTGLISSLILTLLMNIAYKLKWGSWVYPIYLVKALMDKIESGIKNQGRINLSPNLMLLARG